MQRLQEIKFNKSAELKANTKGIFNQPNRVVTLLESSFFELFEMAKVLPHAAQKVILVRSSFQRRKSFELTV